MITLKARNYLVSTALMLLFATRLFANTSQDTIGIKQVRDAIFPLENNLMIIDKLKKDTAYSRIQLLKTKIQLLKANLKVLDQHDSTAIIEKVLKGVTNLKTNEKLHIDSLLPGFTKDVTNLQNNITAYEKNQANKKNSATARQSQGKQTSKDTAKQHVSDTSKKTHKHPDSTKTVKISPSDNSQSDSSQPDNLLLFKLLSAIAFALLVAALFLYYRKIKLNKDVLSANNDLLLARENLTKKNNDLKKGYDNLAEELEDLLKSHESLEAKIKQQEIPTPVFSEKHFFGEVMVTAGPRKNFDAGAKDGDYGLGEDVAGFIIQKDTALFWVLDGTSNSGEFDKPIFTADKKESEYFSSRLLAQSIGWNLQSLISEKPPGQPDVAQLLQDAIAQTESDWKIKIESLDDATQAALADKLKDNKNLLQCSTTAVFGILTVDGHLDICRIGDTKIIAYPSENEFAKSTGRQFVTLQKINEQVELSFKDFSDTRSQLIQLSNIKTLIVMTDGISQKMEDWLKGLKDLNFDRNTRETFARYKQKTDDDKALCIIQIKE